MTFSLGMHSVAKVGENSLTLTPEHPTAVTAKGTYGLPGPSCGGPWEEPGEQSSVRGRLSAQLEAKDRSEI